MAFTEAYVTTAGAGAHDGTSEANAWTFAEMIAATPAAGTRVNMKAGSYTSGTITLPANGTLVLPIVIRGYNATIGDMDSLGKTAAGLLNVTNFPVMTITGVWAPSPCCYLQNISFTGALSSGLISSTTADAWGMVNCKVLNTQNNAAARTVVGDNDVQFINCWMECSGAAHTSVVDADETAILYGCFIKGVAATALITINTGSVQNCILPGTGSSTGISYLGLVSSTNPAVVTGNTLYNHAVAIQFPNSAPNVFPVIVDNHVTDCAKYIDSAYVGTAEYAVVEVSNRTRDNTTARTGILSIVLASEVTTDGGGVSTDFADAGSDDFTPIAGAPGENAASNNGDIGAWQRDVSAGGSGRGLVIGG